MSRIDDLKKELADEEAKLANSPKFPKWIKPHESWIVRSDDGQVTTPDLGECHIAPRSAVLTVMVDSEEQETKATSEKSAPEAPVAEPVVE